MKKVIYVLFVVALFYSNYLSIFAQTQKPLNFVEIKKRLSNYKIEPNINCNSRLKISTCVISSIKQRGIDFVITPEIEQELKLSGASSELIKFITNLSADKYVANGISNLENLNYNEAIDSLSKSITLNHDNLKANYYRGVVYYNKLNYERAVGDFTKVVEIRSVGKTDLSGELPIMLEINTYFYLGNSHYALKDYWAAIIYFSRALKLSPKHILAYNNRGLAYISAKEYELAIKDFDMVIALEGVSSKTYGNRAKAFHQMGKYNQAIVNYSKAIELEPENEIFYINRGNVYNERGNVYNESQKFDEAILDYTKALEINPNSSTAYYNRGVSYRNKKDYEAAIKDFSKSLNLYSNDATVHLQRGILYYEQRKFDSALRDFNEAIKLEKDTYPEAYNNRGLVYLNKEKYEQAIDDFTKAISIAPDNADAYKNRGTAYQALGKTNLAEADLKEYEEVLKTVIRNSTEEIKLEESKSKEAPNAYNQRGTAYQKLGKTNLAEADFKKYKDILRRDTP